MKNIQLLLNRASHKTFLIVHWNLNQLPSLFLHLLLQLRQVKLKIINLHIPFIENLISCLFLIKFFLLSSLIHSFLVCGGSPPMNHFSQKFPGIEIIRVTFLKFQIFLPIIVLLPALEYSSLDEVGIVVGPHAVV